MDSTLRLGINAAMSGRLLEGGTIKTTSRCNPTIELILQLDTQLCCVVEYCVSSSLPLDLVKGPSPLSALNC